jgi:hypothetical protein
MDSRLAATQREPAEAPLETCLARMRTDRHDQ